MSVLHSACKMLVSELLSSHARSKYSVPRRQYKLFAGSCCPLFICD